MGKEFDSFNSILDNRYSCRAFLKETVPLDLLEEIIETAQKVPSWCNAQPWQLTLVEGERLEILREKLWEAGKDLYHQPRHLHCYQVVLLQLRLHVTPFHLK